MKSKRQRYYRELLTSYREYIFFDKEANSDDPDFYWKLEEEVNELADKDPEFRDVRKKVGREYLEDLKFQVFDIPSFLGKLREFSEGKPVEFSDYHLILFGYLYQHQDFRYFRRRCDTNETIRKAATYWLREYQQRFANDEMFAGYALLWKLRRFDRVKLGIKKPDKFDETELKLFDQLYHTNPEFRAICDGASKGLREGVAYWLEEYQKRCSEK